MLKTTFTLEKKRELTHDVYELTYSCDNLSKEPPKPGQYVMFQLLPGLNRSYSIASFSLGSSHTPISQSATFTLIIKRISDGRWSPMICDAPVGTIYTGMLPLGHFILRENTKNKCFIGTGTGFAPLYCQLLSVAQWDQKPEKVSFVFWVRNFEDSFYSEEIEEIKTLLSWLEYTQFFSRESTLENYQSINPSTHQFQGYVTDWITLANIRDYEEFYICGSPAMVKSAREKLEHLWVSKETVYFEQY